jgi:hypothetical protein
MKQLKKIYLSIIAMFVGFILNVMAWTVLPGPNLSTMCLLLGLGLMFGGFIFFIISISKK